MKKFIACAAIAFVFLSLGARNGEAAPSLPQKQPEPFVKLTIKEANVKLRHAPHVDEEDFAFTQVNASETFIAEGWPIKNLSDGSMWYRLLFVVDAKSGEVMDFSRWNEEVFFGSTHAFIDAQYVDLSRLSENEREQVKTSDYLTYPLAPDVSEEAQREAVSTGLYLWNVKVKENVRIYEHPDTSSKVLGESSWGRDDLSVIDVAGRPSSLEWLKIDGSCWQEAFPGGWVEMSDVEIARDGPPLEAFVERYGTLYFGENTPQILARWGNATVTREYDHEYAGGFAMPMFQTKIVAPGLEIELEESAAGSSNMPRSYKITRTGAGVCGIFVGREWCGKDWVKDVLGEPINTATTLESGELWRFHPEGEHNYNLDITFSQDGQVAEIDMMSW